VSEYLGERAVMSANKTTLRRVPVSAFPAWHQDGTFMCRSVRVVNVWVALTACGPGTDAPGLAVVPRRLDDLVPAGTPGSQHTIVVSESVLGDATGGDTVSPTFGPGDALLFDEMMLHATDGRKDDWRQPRYALEAWMFAPSSVPAGYAPMLI